MRRNRHIFTSFAMFAMMVTVACDQGAGRVDNHDFRSSLKKSRASVQWTASLDGVEHLPEDVATLPTAPRLVISAPIELDYKAPAAVTASPDAWQKAHEQEARQRMVEIRAALVNVETGQELAVQTIFVEPNASNDGYLETTLPATFDGDVSVNVAWMDADRGYGGEVVAKVGMEVVMN